MKITPWGFNQLWNLLQCKNWGNSITHRQSRQVWQNIIGELGVKVSTAILVNLNKFCNIQIASKALRVEMVNFDEFCSCKLRSKWATSQFVNFDKFCRSQIRTKLDTVEFIKVDRFCTPKNESKTSYAQSSRIEYCKNYQNLQCPNRVGHKHIHRIM